MSLDNKLDLIIQILLKKNHIPKDDIFFDEKETRTRWEDDWSLRPLKWERWLDDHSAWSSCIDCKSELFPTIQKQRTEQSKFQEISSNDPAIVRDQISDPYCWNCWCNRGQSYWNDDLDPVDYRDFLNQQLRSWC